MVSQTSSGLHYVGDWTEPPVCQGRPWDDPAHDMEDRPVTSTSTGAWAAQCRACFLYHLHATYVGPPFPLEN